jgi:hypothetical protein
MKNTTLNTKTIPELASVMATERRCSVDLLNPCFDDRASDVAGLHTNGEAACTFCTARGLLSRKYFSEGNYVVLNENTLGIILASRTVEVLAGSVIKGGHNPLNGPVAFNPSIDRARLATAQDFETFRMSPKGHDLPGYDIDSTEDLFQEQETLPENIQALISHHTNLIENNEGNGYIHCRDFLLAMEAQGYTFDYGLDGVPYDLQKM